MSKNIFDEALDILVDSFTDPQDEDNDCFMFNFRQIIKIEKAILIAQKQEKLLELYKELSNFYVKLYTMELSELSLNSNYYEIELIKLKQRIKELEK